MAVAMPFELWSWTREFGAPKDQMDAWRDYDIAAALKDLIPWDIFVEKDGTAARRAEQVFGPHSKRHDWLSFFIGTFVGGGVVINGSVFPGRRKNVGGFGPMRVPEHDGGNRLLNHTSLVVLERSIAEAGGDPCAIHDADRDLAELEPMLSAWISGCGDPRTCDCVLAVRTRFRSSVIGGALPEGVKERLVAEVRRKLGETELQGVYMLDVEAGSIGRRARVVRCGCGLHLGPVHDRSEHDAPGLTRMACSIDMRIERRGGSLSRSCRSDE